MKNKVKIKTVDDDKTKKKKQRWNVQTNKRIKTYE